MKRTKSIMAILIAMIIILSGCESSMPEVSNTPPNKIVQSIEENKNNTSTTNTVPPVSKAPKIIYLTTERGVDITTKEDFEEYMTHVEFMTTISFKTMIMREYIKKIPDEIKNGKIKNTNDLTEYTFQGARAYADGLKEVTEVFTKHNLYSKYQEQAEYEKDLVGMYEILCGELEGLSMNSNNRQNFLESLNQVDPYFQKAELYYNKFALLRKELQSKGYTWKAYIDEWKGIKN